MQFIYIINTKVKEQVCSLWKSLGTTELEHGVWFLFVNKHFGSNLVLSFI